MKIQLNDNSFVEAKDVFTRKMEKEMNQILFSGLSAGLDGKPSGNVGLSEMDKANDYVLTTMVTKVVIDGAERPVTAETFDEMSARDVKKVIEKLNRLTKNTDEEEKK